MSLAIFKADFRRYWKLLLVFTVVLLFYFVVMMSMFNPTNGGVGRGDGEADASGNARRIRHGKPLE